LKKVKKQGNTDRTIHLQRWLVICILVINAHFASGQSRFQSWSVESNFHLGRIIKHSPKLLFDINGLTSATELNFSYQTFGKKEWQQHQRYPQMGISLFYHDLGNAAVFGEAWSVIPHINVALHHSLKYQLGFRFGIGLAYLTKPYDVFTNPTNNAFGAHKNSGVLFEINNRWQVNKYWQLRGGLSFMHYSNGTNRLPNFGLNVPALVVGARYTPYLVAKADYTHYDVPKKRDKKWGAQMWLCMANRERGTSGGPSYPVYNVSLSTHFYLNKINRLSFGAEYEYNKSVYEFGKHVAAFNSEAEARRGAARTQLFVGDEFLFGSWGFTILTGIYTSRQSYLLPGPVYNKVITRYYFPEKGKMKWHVGVYLKSHFVIAEYMGFGLGTSF
jgi:Lipid A 3-O-deacylase (PagL)